MSTFHYHLGDAHETANSERKFQQACRRIGARIQVLDIRVRPSFQNSVAAWDTSTVLQWAATSLPNLHTFSMKLYPRHHNNRRDGDDGTQASDEEEEGDNNNDNSPQGLHRISSRALAALILNATKLTSLSLIHVGIDHDGGILPLANALRSHPALESVRLVDCMPCCSSATAIVEDDQLRAAAGTRLLPVIEALARIPTLKTVLLTKVVMHDQEYDPGRLPADVRAAIQRAFVQLAGAHRDGGCSLRCLAIKHCPGISEENDMLALARSLEEHPTLIHWTFEPLEQEPERSFYEDPATNEVRVGQHPLPKFQQFMRVLGISLQLNFVLEDVTVRYNDEDLTPIANALEINHTLKAFHFVGVGANRAPVDPHVIEKLTTMLKEKNYTLQHIGGNQARGWSQEMAFYLLLNRAGRQLLLTKDPNTGRSASIEDWIRAIIENKDHVGVIFYLLSSDQSLILEVARQKPDATTTISTGSSAPSTTGRSDRSNNRKRRINCEDEFREVKEGVSSKGNK